MRKTLYLWREADPDFANNEEKDDVFFSNKPPKKDFSIRKGASIATLCVSDTDYMLDGLERNVVYKVTLKRIK